MRHHGAAVATEPARYAGIDVPWSEVASCLGKDVLLVERFGRTSVPGERRMIVSALTILGPHELIGQYASLHTTTATRSFWHR